MTEDEYSAGLDRMEVLIAKNPDPMSPDAKEMEELSEALDEYERVHFPEFAPDPDEKERPEG